MSNFDKSHLLSSPVSHFLIGEEGVLFAIHNSLLGFDNSQALFLLEKSPSKEGIVLPFDDVAHFKDFASCLYIEVSKATNGNCDDCGSPFKYNGPIFVRSYCKARSHFLPDLENLYVDAAAISMSNLASKSSQDPEDLYNFVESLLRSLNQNRDDDLTSLTRLCIDFAAYNLSSHVFLALLTWMPKPTTKFIENLYEAVLDTMGQVYDGDSAVDYYYSYCETYHNKHPNGSGCLASQDFMFARTFGAEDRQMVSDEMDTW
ncbi:MAG: hypothetical protein M1825_004251 [Sarcosagium campestre]|nr:MAG: hypothetical protein M1825_004251 [Sarcosagium campestre]